MLKSPVKLLGKARDTIVPSAFRRKKQGQPGSTEEDCAATKLQSMFRGKQARRRSGAAAENKAAAKVQATYRGRLARQTMGLVGKGANYLTMGAKMTVTWPSLPQYRHRRGHASRQHVWHCAVRRSQIPARGCAADARTSMDTPRGRHRYG